MLRCPEHCTTSTCIQKPNIKQTNLTQNCSEVASSWIHHFAVVHCYSGTPLRLHTLYDARARQIQTFKYEARTRKVNRHSWSSLNKTNQNSASANIVNTIRLLGFHWAWHMASYFQTFEYNTYTHKVNRHSWSLLNKHMKSDLKHSTPNKSKTPLQPTSSMPLGFSAVTEHEKWP